MAAASGSTVAAFDILAALEDSPVVRRTGEKTSLSPSKSPHKKPATQTSVQLPAVASLDGSSVLPETTPLGEKTATETTIVVPPQAEVGTLMHLCQLQMHRSEQQMEPNLGPTA